MADKVRSLDKLRSQEASHKGQIDKLELAQVDSQPDNGEVGEVFDPTAPAPLNPGPFESCDEDMLFDASEGEDEGEACRSNGIWERRRSGVIKKGKLVKNMEKLRRSKVNPLLLRKRVSVLLRVLLLPGNNLWMCLRACLRMI